MTDLPYVEQLIVQFQSGITLLYCFWATPPKHRTDNYHSPDVSNALRACSNILAIMADRWPKADCLRDVFELLTREIPLINHPTRPRTRVSERSATAIREKLPQVRTMVVHRSILRMLDEMVSEEFPRSNYSAPTTMEAAEVNIVSASQADEAIANHPPETESVAVLFEMPFSADQVYTVDRSTIISSGLGGDEFLEFPRMFDFNI
jgi:hypothetical protein